MKILKKRNTLVAYRDANDTNMNDLIKVGDELGRINIKTGKFVGNTVALVVLTTKRIEYTTDDVDNDIIVEDVKMVTD